MKQLQKGFGAVEAIIIIFIIALIGAGAWFVFNQKNNDESPQTTDNSTVDQTPAEEVDEEVQNWQLVESGQGGFSIRIPDGWKVTNFLPTNNIRSNDVNYQPGMPAEVTNEDYEYAGDGPSRFSVIQFKQGDNYSMLDGDEQQEEFKVADLVGTKYYKKYPVQEAEGIGVYPGSEKYIYEFKTEDTTTYAIYNVYNYNEYSHSIWSDLTESDINQVDLVDRAVKTLTVN